MFSFIAEPVETGNKIYLPIPFNIWERCFRKGLIPAHVIVEGIAFECRLLPKGHGNYLIPITKSLINQIGKAGKWEVQFEFIKEPSNGYCGQVCISMLAGIKLEEVIKVMHSKKWQASLSKVIETLDYYGLSHADRFIYTKGRTLNFPKMLYY